MRVVILVLCACICAFGLLELSRWKARENPLNKVMELEIFDIYDIQDKGKVKHGVWPEKDDDALGTVLYARNGNKNGGESSAVIRHASVRKTRDDNAKDSRFDMDEEGSALLDTFEEEQGPQALPRFTYDGVRTYTAEGEAQKLKEGLEEVYQQLCDAKAELETVVRQAILLGAIIATTLILMLAFLNQMYRHYKETGEWCPNPAAPTMSTYTSGSIPGSLSNSHDEPEEVGTRV